MAEATPLCLDLLEQMLRFNPEDRITVKQALDHPYFAVFAPEDNPIFLEAIAPEVFAFEEEFLPLDQDERTELMRLALLAVHGSAADNLNMSFV
jgi:hypothetical protein